MSLLLICVETITLRMCNLPRFNPNFFFKLRYNQCLALICNLILSRTNYNLWILKLSRNFERLYSYLTYAKSRSEILKCFNRHWHASLFVIISLLFFLCYSANVLVELLIYSKLSFNILRFLIFKPVLKLNFGS